MERMKRVAGFVGCMVAALYVVASPHAAQGQTAGTRYGTGRPCPAYITPRGTYQYPAGVDKDTLAIKVDLAFAEKMKKERFLENLPVAPIYDLVVEAVPTWGVCYTERPENYSTIPPKQLPFPVFVEVEGEKIAGPGVLQNSGRKSDDGRFVYEWKIKGWPDGIASGEKLEKLIENAKIVKPFPGKAEIPDVLLKKIQPKVVVGETGLNHSERVEQDAAFDTCAPLSGIGAHKFIYGRGKSAGLSVPAFVGATEDVRTSGFEKIDPFKKYARKFSHIIDLAQSNDETIGLLGRSAFLSSSAIISRIRSNSSCNFYSSKEDETYLLRTNLEGVLINGMRFDGIASLNKAALVTPRASVETAMHEIGHAFAQLWDEEGTQLYTAILPGRNCSIAPITDFAWEGKQYGEGTVRSVAGCNHIGWFGKEWSGRKEDYEIGQRVFRPTPTSLMTYDDDRPMKFNVVSCGYVVAAINGGNGPEYWPECVDLNTVKPTGLSNSLLKNLLVFFAKPVSAAESVNENENFQRGALIFEQDTPLDNVPAAGVVWYDGEAKPKSLQFTEVPPTASMIESLRARMKELTTQRNELRARRDRMRGVWNVPPAPTSPSPFLNAAPLRQQLGDISAALQSILESVRGAAR